jgi:RHS repeat-associated protein
MNERFEYQDAQLNDTLNLNGQLVRRYDPSGRVEMVRRDFKGNLLESKRRLNKRPLESLIDWQAMPESLLEAETFTQITQFDALNRMTVQYNWHRASPDNQVAVFRPEYNERGSLVREALTIRARKIVGGADIAGDTIQSQPIKEIRYNARGQKEFLVLGNGSITRYQYDKKTFRLRELRTTRPAYDPPFSAYRGALNDAQVLQQLRYTYDPVGNIAEVYDEAYKPAFFQNAIIEPRGLYEYDALYRLIEATGREDGAATGAPTQLESSPREGTFPIPGVNAVRKYSQSYRYDPVGNIKEMSHDGGPTGSWTREYAYLFEDPAQSASNRLWRTWQGDPDWNGANAINRVTHVHDTHGNVRNLAQVLPDKYLKWDHRDMIASINLGGGGEAHYQYDSSKQRTRKRIDDQNGLGGYWERIYFGGYELYRRYSAANSLSPVELIESHHLADGEQSLLLVDEVIISSTGTLDVRPDGLTVQAQTLFRYQYANHLGSACLELDADASTISYEEYHPYGTSAYRARGGGIEAPPKRYRLTGMERDEESGLSYHAARYYASWMARWSCSDPIGIQDGPNVYQYGRSRPTTLKDPSGKNSPAPNLGTEGPPPNVELRPLADDPALKDIAEKLTERMRSDKYENFAKNLHKAIRKIVEAPEADPLQDTFSVEKATRRLIFKSGPYKGQYLEFAHDVSQSQIKVQGLDPGLATDPSNLYPVGDKFHDDWLHSIDYLTNYGQLPSPYDEALKQPNPIDAFLAKNKPKVATAPLPPLPGKPIADPLPPLPGKPIADPLPPLPGKPNEADLHPPVTIVTAQSADPAANREQQKSPTAEPSRTQALAKTLGVSVGAVIVILAISRIIRLAPPLLPLQLSPI